MRMSKSVAVGGACLLLSIPFAATAVAAPRPVPIPKVGTCPTGYVASFSTCNPTPGAKLAVLKSGSFCPTGYYTSWKYCVSQR